MVKSVLVWYGGSIAGRDNVYTGWNDMPLSKKEVEQAKGAGLKVARIPDFAPTRIHASVLSRAAMTANIIANACSFLCLSITKTWYLNKKHYGALRDINKDVSRKISGKEQVLKQRRKSDSVLPLLTQPVQGHRYQKYDMHLTPQGEGLHQTQGRLVPCFWDRIAPELISDHDQLIVAHGSSLHALIRKIESISSKGIVKVEIPDAEPIAYTFGSGLHIIKKKILY